MRNFDLPGRSPVLAENGLASTSHPLATATALHVLRDGGNAVDAAIAASATLCVVEPHMTGIGGDCFAIVAEPDGTIHGLNGSGRAPAAADPEQLRAAGHQMMPEFGAFSVTVPAAVKGWETLLERFGSREFSALFADAIRYGEEGFAVHPRVARDWARHVEGLAADASSARHWLVDGGAPQVGQRFRAPALAGTFRRVASGGAKAFYEGDLAREMSQTVQAAGGWLGEEDLAAVSADWVDLISVPYGGHDVFEIPPNGQGITALILLRLMERAQVGRMELGSADRFHAMIELGRLAYSVRDHLVSDPRTMTVSPAELLSDRSIEALLQSYAPDKRNPEIVLPDFPRSSTIYLTVVDRDRRAVSFINSVYDAFGSRVTTPQSAIALQNRGSGFSLVEGHPNELGAGKRPMHTIIPAMAKREGRASVSFGVMGGDYQPMGHARVFSALADDGLDPQAALDAPRLFWDDNGVLTAETGIAPAVRKDLESRGHQIKDAPSPHGGGQVIVIDHPSGFLQAGSDPRKDGCALGW